MWKIPKMKEFKNVIKNKICEEDLRRRSFIFDI